MLGDGAIDSFQPAQQAFNYAASNTAGTGTGTASQPAAAAGDTAQSSAAEQHANSNKYVNGLLDAFPRQGNALDIFNEIVDMDANDEGASGKKNAKEDRQFGFDESQLKGRLKALEDDKTRNPGNAANDQAQEKQLLGDFKKNVDQRQTERTTGGPAYQPSAGNPFKDGGISDSDAAAAQKQATAARSHGTVNGPAEAKVMLHNDQGNNVDGSPENERNFGLTTGNLLQRLNTLESDKGHNPANTQADNAKENDILTGTGGVKDTIHKHDQNLLG